MSEVTRILSAMEQGDPHAADELLPLVYDELRKLAARKMAQGARPDASIHRLGPRAYLRLVEVEAATTLNLSAATAYRHWTFARAWLHSQMDRRPTDSDG
jgi:ECF sigma factor